MKGFSTIHCQLLSKFSIGKGKSKGIGALISWEVHLGMGQNRTKPFKNRIDKLRMERWKNQTEGNRNIWGIILILLDIVDSSEINKGQRSCPRRHRSAHWKRKFTLLNAKMQSEDIFLVLKLCFSWEFYRDWTVIKR